MQYLALATDYDGTLATKSYVDEATVVALEHWRNSGRRLILITGRQVDELIEIFPQLAYFDWVVAENGALLYQPATQLERLLAPPANTALVKWLSDRHVSPLSIGKVIISTWQPHDETVKAAIQELGLDLHIITNKAAVMVLPTGVDKASGLSAVLAEMNLSLHQTVGVGDAENDSAFLEICGFSVAVANALPPVKHQVNWITQAERGAGVAELIWHILESDRDPDPD